ncbi:MAG: 2-oxoacid:acceptor oxidoreductase family protein [Candidatus Pacearchaeota archaeon]|nr:2-oxoacid:acceptor oxidoreductase family protein [Candidatus Pacearchaeota archaeon]
MAQRYNLLFGGPAGSGPNILTNILGETLVKMGYYVFYSRDYQSLIRGGHNFNVLTFSEEPVNSNDSEIDILVAFDDNTENLHKKNLKKNGILLKGNKENMYYAGRIFKLLCIEFSVLDGVLKNLGKRYDENIKEAKQGYEEETKNICKILPKKGANYFMNGNQGITEGAINSNIEIYYAYPMTPATPILNELAEKENVKVIGLENEIAVINAGIGSSIIGKNVMVGTSGGGFDLMTEALSMAGMAEVPIVAYLSQRMGPGTGVATYTSQGDLNLALNFGHGEFSRIVVAPGDPKEAQELTNQAFYLSQKFKMPSIILGDKHLAESFYTLTEKPSFMKIKNETPLIRYNSYEKDAFGGSTENPDTIKANVERRLNKIQEIKKEVDKFSKFSLSGKPNSQNIIVGWGSTKGAIIDTIKDLNTQFIQMTEDLSSQMN